VVRRAPGAPPIRELPPASGPSSLAPYLRVLVPVIAIKISGHCGTHFTIKKRYCQGPAENRAYPKSVGGGRLREDKEASAFNHLTGYPQHESGLAKENGPDVTALPP